MADHGRLLFNVVSKERLKQVACGNGTFDREFYDNQVNPEKRKLVSYLDNASQ